VRRLLSVLFWSVIAAAFIGPGTITTAAAAGSGHRYALLWALAFSTFACLVLQEAAARLTIVSGRDLGQALRGLYGAGPQRLLLLALIVGAVVVGCAAYEAGNILGAAVGLRLAFGLSSPIATIALGTVAALLLWTQRPHQVARWLGLSVGLMGVLFVAVAIALKPDVMAVLRGLTVPAMPIGSGILVLGLVGTTVVPYNLFLGSGIATGQRLGEMRFGLTVAVLLGGAISAAVMVVGSTVAMPFSLDALAAVLATRLGGWAAIVFAGGLAAAGLSSAITAPLAAAVTARSLSAAGGESYGGGTPRVWEAPGWDDRGWRFRAVWSSVLLVGVGFGLADVRPVPVIVLAQALNGVLLPLATAFLLLAINDRSQVGVEGLNGRLSNGAMVLVLFVTLQLGGANVVRALAVAGGLRIDPAWLLGGTAGVAALLTLAVGTRLRRRRGA